MQYLLHSVPAGRVRHQTTYICSNNYYQFLHRSNSLTFSINNKNAHISTEASSDPQSTNSSSFDTDNNKKKHRNQPLIIVILFEFLFLPVKRFRIDRSSFEVCTQLHLPRTLCFVLFCLFMWFVFTERSNQQRSWERKIENKLTSNCSLFLVHALSFIFS